MKLKCRCCGEIFSPTQEEREIFEEGYGSLPTQCDDCFNVYVNQLPDYELPSDADPGL